MAYMETDLLGIDYPGRGREEMKKRKIYTFDEHLMEILRKPSAALAYLEASLEFGNKQILHSVFQIAKANGWKSKRGAR